jgi:hypothetical protein
MNGFIEGNGAEESSDLLFAGILMRINTDEQHEKLEIEGRL